MSENHLSDNDMLLDLKMPFQELLSHDYAWFHERKIRKSVYIRLDRYTIAKNISNNSTFRFVFLIRLVRRLWHSNQKIKAAILRKCIFHLYHTEISFDAMIGPGIQIPHPQGIIIGGHTRIGYYTHIGQQVTIGGNVGKKNDKGREFPIIGDYVRIMPGSVVVGPVSVGNHSIIGANSVVVHDVPPNTVVSGIPAVPLNENREKIQLLEERIARLEAQLTKLEHDKLSYRNV